VPIVVRRVCQAIQQTGTGCLIFSTRYYIGESLDARNPLALRDASAERSAIAAKKATLKQRARYTEAGLVVEESCTIIL